MSNHQTQWLKNDKWLSQQDLLTRSLLIGRGIVCGLQPTFDEKDCTLWLCGGLGLTSDGTLIKPGKEKYHFTHYRLYEPPEYALFQNGEEESLPVWELLNKRKKNSKNEVKSLTPQNPREAMTPFLAEKVLLIFLEPKPEEKGEETPDDPPTDSPNQPQQGPKEEGESLIPRYRMRFLLMRQQDIIEKAGLSPILKKILGHKNLDADYVYSDEYSQDDDRAEPKDIVLAQTPKLGSAEIPLRRFGFGCLDPFDCQPEELEESQFPDIQSLDDIYENYVCIINAATKVLDKEMRKLMNWLSSFLSCREVVEMEEILDQLCAKWEVFKKLNTLKDTDRHRKEHVQYFYDWCRDLLAAYHELRSSFFALMADCQPDPEAFPRHLLLGLVLHPAWANYPHPLRHYFQQPPVYNGNAERLEKIRHDQRRFLLLIKGFYLPYSLPDQLLNPYCQIEEDGDEADLPNMFDIKVTPGYYYDHLLERQTIPYYYPLTESRFSVHRFWSFPRSWSLSEDRLLSYHAMPGEDSYTRHPSIIRPLRYNIDRTPFFRIEGHIGKSRSEVTIALAKWQQKYNLSFDIIYRSVDQLTEAISSADGEQFFTFQAEILGAEHLAGVLAGGTFIVVHEKDKVIADFSLPYRCCRQEVPEEPEEPTPNEVEVRGELLACETEKPAMEVKVKVGNKVVASDNQGRFVAKLPPGDYQLGIESTEYVQINQSFTVGEASKDLGTIGLRPLRVKVRGSIRRGNTAIKGAVFQLLLKDDNKLETTSDDKGMYIFEQVPRGEWAMFYQSSGSNNELALTVNPDCAEHIVPDINLSEELQPFPNNFNATAFLDDRFYEALSVEPQSARAKELQVFYNDRIGHYVSSFAEVRGVGTVNEMEGFKATETAIAEIINNPELSTNQLHRLYKSATAGLEADIKEAKAADKKTLLSSAESLNKLYLYRIAINQPDGLTAGTENALKDAHSRGFKLDKSVKEWSAEVKDHIAPSFLEGINKWRPS